MGQTWDGTLRAISIYMSYMLIHAHAYVHVHVCTHVVFTLIQGLGLLDTHANFSSTDMHMCALRMSCIVF